MRGAFEAAFKVEESSPSGLIWLSTHKCSNKRGGDFAGTQRVDFYWKIKFRGKNYQAHRVIALLTGLFTEEEFKDPSVQIDHIDCDRSNNKIANLRKVTNRENACNKLVHRAGKLAGCTFHNRDKVWQAQIRVEGKPKYLGSFDTEQEAHAAYIKFKEENT